jgi:hypothetical protein
VGKAFRPGAGGMSKQPSISVQTNRMKEQAKSGQISEEQLDAIGLLPSTFVWPTGKNLPRWFKDPRGRLNLLLGLGRVRFWEYLR